MRRFVSAPWKADPSGRLIEPLPFGDSELVELEMSHSSITMTFSIGGPINQLLKEASWKRKFRIACDMPRFVALESDHLQNVVDDFWLFEDRSKAKEFATFSGKRLFPTSYLGEAKYYFFITPIVGIELFAAVESVEVLVEQQTPR